jgi:quinol monooxygenase YgiN
MAIVLISSAKPIPGKEKDFEKLFTEGYIDVAKKEEGVLQATLIKHQERPGEYLLYTVWRSKEDWKAFNDLPIRKSFRGKIDSLLSSPPTRDWFDIIAEK